MTDDSLEFTRQVGRIKPHEKPYPARSSVQRGRCVVQMESGMQCPVLNATMRKYNYYCEWHYSQLWE